MSERLMPLACCVLLAYQTQSDKVTSDSYPSTQVVSQDRGLGFKTENILTMLADQTLTTVIQKEGTLTEEMPTSDFLQADLGDIFLRDV